MTPPVVRINPNMRRVILALPGVSRDLRRRGQAVAASARAAAPVESGDLRRSISVVDEDHHGRPVVHVVAEQPYASVVAADDAFLVRALAAARR